MDHATASDPAERRTRSAQQLLQRNANQQKGTNDMQLAGTCGCEVEQAGSSWSKPELAGASRIEPEQAGASRIEPEQAGASRSGPERAGFRRISFENPSKSEPNEPESQPFQS